MTPESQAAEQMQEGQGPPNMFIDLKAAVCRGLTDPEALVFIMTLARRLDAELPACQGRALGSSWPSGILGALTTQPAHLFSLSKPFFNLPPWESPPCLSIPSPAPTPTKF